MKSNFRLAFSRLLILFCAAFLLSGCDLALMNPKGQIGMEQKSIFIFATLIMLIVVLPPIIMAWWFAWRYRESNKSATYKPNWAHSNVLEVIVWGIPCIIILILGIMVWRTSHSLDPHKAIVSENKPVEIQVIALDWKWLFIYPEEKVASINEIAIPVNTPVTFKLTSYTAMNSFFIPQLGSQLYAMAGMENNLNLIANEVGVYKGVATNISGLGFSDMKFSVHAVSDADYANWIDNAKRSGTGSPLNRTTFDAVAEPTIKAPVQYFYPASPDLYLTIINEFMGPHSKENHKADAGAHLTHSANH